MILKPFEYVAPNSLSEACKVLSEHSDAKVIAGGQSLLPIMKLNLTELDYLVDLKRIPGLSYIKIDKDVSSDGKEALFAGALATHSDVASSDLVRRTIPLLSKTASSIGHPLVRNRGTIGGSLSHCDPAADMCVTSLALDARMTITNSSNTKRVVHAEDFFQGTFTTALEKGEILEKICFPIPPNSHTQAFEKITMGHGDFPLVVVSTVLDIGKGICNQTKLALGGVSDKVIRIKRAEEALIGKKLDEDSIDNAASIAEEESKPAADLDVSAEYKKKMVRVLVRRALRKASQGAA
ncbi:MAG: xanthine dehydrogenase family protein subunit M [Nitrososphaerota archaeon]|nr:xanthine dehydrogenase family protein subunit M [Nitrososphaerota archaeon]